jgi:hypothetical protein
VINRIAREWGIQGGGSTLVWCVIPETRQRPSSSQSR